MNISPISPETRSKVNAFLEANWYSTIMILRSKEIDLSNAEGFCALENGEIIALLTFITYDDTLEITSLDSLVKGQGIGSRLIELAVSEAKNRGCRRIALITTNDNTNALRFYQKRGFDISRLYRNAMDEARSIKPDIPLIGENGIPLRHEIELEMLL